MSGPVTPVPKRSDALLTNLRLIDGRDIAPRDGLVACGA